jgi:hypothetical protein
VRASFSLLFMHSAQVDRRSFLAGVLDRVRVCMCNRIIFHARLHTHFHHIYLPHYWLLSRKGVPITEWTKFFYGKIFFYLLQLDGKKWNNLSLHHLRAFVTMTQRVNISRGACSTWAVALLQMV